jgi:hypothetical protein
VSGAHRRDGDDAPGQGRPGHDAPDRPVAGHGDEGLADDPVDEELAVRTIELDDDEGDKVVIAQQNMAGRRQSGGGEYKNVAHAPTVGEAAAEQDLVDASTREPSGVDARDPEDPALDAVDEANRERPGETSAWSTAGDETPA